MVSATGVVYFCLKLQSMKSIFFIACSCLVVLLSCERTDYEPGDPGSYDTEYKIFRVKVNSDSNTPYSVSIKRERPASGASAAIDQIEVNQNTGVSFDYGFSPAIGETVKVTVKSSRNDIKPYAFYKGKYTLPLELKSVAGTYSAELNYRVEE